jgi:hypothetical protein
LLVVSDCRSERRETISIQIFCAPARATRIAVRLTSSYTIANAERSAERKTRRNVFYCVFGPMRTATW